LISYQLSQKETAASGRIAKHILKGNRSFQKQIYTGSFDIIIEQLVEQMKEGFTSGFEARKGMLNAEGQWCAPTRRTSFRQYPFKRLSIVIKRTKPETRKFVDLF
jgi:hypothetical protein